MPDEGTTAVATTAPSDATLRDRELSLVPSLVNTEDRPMFPVSMVVHGGTGVMHGNMTSLTVNQYIGVEPDRSVWDTGKVRELMADAVKVSADANSQLFHPEAPTSSSSSGYQSKLSSKKPRRNGWLLLIAGLVLLCCLVPLGTMAIYTEFFSPDPLLEPYDIEAMTAPSNEVEKFVDDLANRENSPGILPRSVWLAQSPRRSLENNTLPIYMVVVADTQTEECFTSSDCVFHMRSQQMYDIDFKKFDDIGYNFMIGGDGNMYTGRGWDSKGAHTEGYDTGTLGVAFIGTFSRSLPKDVQVTAFNKLVKTGVEINKISANYTLVNRCQLRNDGYSDLALATNMTTWPHFDSSFPITKCTLNETDFGVL